MGLLVGLGWLHRWEVRPLLGRSPKCPYNLLARLTPSTWRSLAELANVEV
jgi:hypothetical protein